MSGEYWDDEPVAIQTTEFRRHEERPRPNQYQNKRPNFKTNRNVNNSNKGISMEVPSRSVGRIIGRGGSKITDLQFESGAKIQVTKEIVGDNTIVRINGTDEEMQKAKEMIQDLIIEKEHRSQNQLFENRESQELVKKNDLQENRPAIDWGVVFAECDRHQQARWDKLPPIKKHFYEEHVTVTNMSRSEVEEFRMNNNNIVVSRIGGDTAKLIPNPVQTFEQAFHNYPLILEEIRKVGFEKPSPIQSQGWPVLLSGEDLIGIAQTGTGKTLAFLLPALIHIEGQIVPREERIGPSVLVMAPTRELALQIDREVKKYNYRDITAVCIYGGGNRREQVNVISQGVDIIIATPGRLNDLVSAGHISVEGITYLVLDEADRMLDMGFEPQIRKTLFDIRPDRQTIMTSATWPPGVRRLADSYMKNPIQVYVGSLDLAAVHSVTQTIIMMSDDEMEKFDMFMNFVHNMQPDEKVIVFCGKKSRADHLSSELCVNGVDCQSIHGDREQVDREQALADIVDGTVQILIATDVASRGLDIEDITHVINYDFPRNIEEYVHRVGRTGRAGRTGQSISYFTRGDWANAKELIQILEEADQAVPQELYQMSERYKGWKERKDQERDRGGGRFNGRYSGNRDKFGGNRW